MEPGRCIGEDPNGEFGLNGEEGCENAPVPVIVLTIMLCRNGFEPVAWGCKKD